MYRIVCALFGLVMVAQVHAAPEPPFHEAGGVLADTAGRTVYIYDLDTKPGSSTCVSQCALLWPPVYAAANATANGSDYEFVIRDDGRRQWSWQGNPLYYWLGDRAPGDRTGDGVDDVWHVVEIVVDRAP